MKNIDNKKDKVQSFYEVERILDKRKEGNRYLYFVKWKGYSEDQSTWETNKTLRYCKQFIHQYQKNIKIDHPQVQKKGESQGQKYISIVSESDDIQVRAKYKDRKMQSNHKTQSQKKQKSAQKRQGFIINDDKLLKDSIDGLINLFQTQEKQSFEQNQKNTLKSDKKSSIKVEKESISKKRQTRLSLTLNKSSDSGIQQESSVFIAYKPKGQETSEKLNSNEDEKLSDSPQIIENPSRKDVKIHQKDTRQHRLLLKENRLRSKKQALQLKKAKKRQARQKNKKILESNKKRREDLLGTNSISYMKSMSEKKTRQQKKNYSQAQISYRGLQKSNQYSKQCIPELQNSKNFKLMQLSNVILDESSGPKKIQRIRLIEQEPLKEIREYVIEYQGGELKIFNTLSLFAAHPLDYCEYLEGKKIILN